MVRRISWATTSCYPNHGTAGTVTDGMRYEPGATFVRSISERDMAVVIPLLAAKIRELTAELHATEERMDELSDEERRNRMDLQDLLHQYEIVLDSLRAEYEDALRDVSNLPSYDELVRT